MSIQTLAQELIEEFSKEKQEFNEKKWLNIFKQHLGDGVKWKEGDDINWRDASIVKTEWVGLIGFKTEKETNKSREDRISVMSLFCDEFFEAFSKALKDEKNKLDLNRIENLEANFNAFTKAFTEKKIEPSAEFAQFEAINFSIKNTKFEWKLRKQQAYLKELKIEIEKKTKIIDIKEEEKKLLQNLKKNLHKSDGKAEEFKKGIEQASTNTKLVFEDAITSIAKAVEDFTKGCEKNGITPEMYENSDEYKSFYNAPLNINQSISGMSKFSKVEGIAEVFLDSLQLETSRLEEKTWLSSDIKKILTFAWELFPEIDTLSTELKSALEKQPLDEPALDLAMQKLGKDITSLLTLLQNLQFFEKDLKSWEKSVSENFKNDSSNKKPLNIQKKDAEDRIKRLKDEIKEEREKINKNFPDFKLGLLESQIQVLSSAQKVFTNEKLTTIVSDAAALRKKENEISEKIKIIEDSAFCNLDLKSIGTIKYQPLNALIEEGKKFEKQISNLEKEYSELGSGNNFFKKNENLKLKSRLEKLKELLPKSSNDIFENEKEFHIMTTEQFNSSEKKENSAPYVCIRDGQTISKFYVNGKEVEILNSNELNKKFADNVEKNFVRSGGSPKKSSGSPLHNFKGSLSPKIKETENPKITILTNAKFNDLINSKIIGGVSPIVNSDPLSLLENEKEKRDQKALQDSYKKYNEELKKLKLGITEAQDKVNKILLSGSKDELSLFSKLQKTDELLLNYRNQSQSIVKPENVEDPFLYSDEFFELYSQNKTLENEIKDELDNLEKSINPQIGQQLQTFYENELKTLSNEVGNLAEETSYENINQNIKNLELLEKKFDDLTEKINKDFSVKDFESHTEAFTEKVQKLKKQYAQQQLQTFYENELQTLSNEVDNLAKDISPEKIDKNIEDLELLEKKFNELKEKINKDFPSVKDFETNIKDLTEKVQKLKKLQEKQMLQIWHQKDLRESILEVGDQKGILNALEQQINTIEKELNSEKPTLTLDELKKHLDDLKNQREKNFTSLEKKIFGTRIDSFDEKIKKLDETLQEKINDQLLTQKLDEINKKGNDLSLDTKDDTAEKIGEKVNDALKQITLLEEELKLLNISEKAKVDKEKVIQKIKDDLNLKKQELFESGIAKLSNMITGFYYDEEANFIELCKKVEEVDSAMQVFNNVEEGIQKGLLQDLSKNVDNFYQKAWKKCIHDIEIVKTNKEKIWETSKLPGDKKEKMMGVLDELNNTAVDLGEKVVTPKLEIKISISDAFKELQKSVKESKAQFKEIGTPGFLDYVCTALSWLSRGLYSYSYKWAKEEATGVEGDLTNIEKSAEVGEKVFSRKKLR